MRFLLSAATMFSLVLACGGGGGPQGRALEECPVPSPAVEASNIPDWVPRPSGVTFRLARSQPEAEIAEGDSTRSLDELYTAYIEGARDNDLAVSFSEKDKQDAEIALLRPDARVLVILRLTCKDRTDVRVSVLPFEPADPSGG